MIFFFCLIFERQKLKTGKILNIKYFTRRSFNPVNEEQVPIAKGDEGNYFFLQEYSLRFRESIYIYFFYINRFIDMRY